MVAAVPHQPGLFDRSARAATRDPLSSHRVADDLERSGRGARQAALVLDLVRRTPGLTSGELAARHGVDRHLVARRLPELAQRGLVRRIEHGSQQVSWEAVE